MGIPTYWIADGDARTVEVWTPDTRLPAVADAAVTWRAPGATETLTIHLADLFKPI